MPKVKIKIQNLYKIFGNNPTEAVEKVKQGINKSDLLKNHEHIIGLNNVNIDIIQGKITVIMGLSGSGKSTLVRHLNRLIEPTSGSILIDGEDVLAMSAKELLNLRQTRLSMVFQKFALFPHKTVKENVVLAPHTRGEKPEDYNLDAQTWLDRVGLVGFEDYYPKQLSGGMQQRVGIARALASNSEVMLMDESFSALDPLIRNSMQDLLLELQNSLLKTIVFISHDLDEALKLADKLIILKDGAVVQQGNPQEILLNPNDKYVEDFVSHINRARVLKVGTVMKKFTSKKTASVSDSTITIKENDNLEEVIAKTEGNIAISCNVVDEGGNLVGMLDMNQVVKSLVPKFTSDSGNLYL